MASVVLSVEHLSKTFHKPFTRRRVEAVRDVSFEVRKGEVFGFVGPNGAGKTTTIKMLMGLIFATGGKATIFGHDVPSPEAMRKVGFLPENPYVYPYLTPREFVTLCGRLSGLSGDDLSSRVEQVIAKVGIAYAIDRPVRALSKGMGQRVGLAAALVHGPELLVLDEPMSGLDPVGRKDVRDIILEERAAGRTVFFSTHILSDVEALCDRVCILRKGEVVLYGAMKDLLHLGAEESEIVLEGASDELLATVARDARAVREVGAQRIVVVQDDQKKRAVVEAVLASGARLVSVTPKRETLEEVFVRRAL
jgi:ABC-2 type transport system ATP-binding protein